MVVVRSQVDFDDEGWLGGFVDSLREDEEGGVVYTVRLDDGEMADDVEGSEIRPAELRPARGGRGGGGADDGTLAAGGDMVGLLYMRPARDSQLVTWPLSR